MGPLVTKRLDAIAAPQARPSAAAAKQTIVMARAGPNSVGLCAGVNGNLSFDILLSLSLFRGPTKPSKAAFESLRERRDSVPPLPEEAYSPLFIQTACPRP